MVYLLAVLIKRHAGRLVLPALLLTLWLLPAWMTSPAGPDEAAAARQPELIRRVAAQSIRPGDDVFLSTMYGGVRRAVEDTGASVHVFDTAAAFPAQLVNVLDAYCARAAYPDAYLVWTGDAAAMAGPARDVNVYFRFEALLPYEGYNVYAVDKIVRLRPKAEMIARYCEAVEIAAGRDVVAILEPGAFTPWIGSVTTGQVTLLAADPVRTSRLSDFTVVNMPPVAAYDAHWMGITEEGFTWSFKNRDAEAYREVFTRPGVKDALLLIDKGAVIGPVAERYIRECDDNLNGGVFFRRLCLKP